MQSNNNNIFIFVNYKDNDKAIPVSYTHLKCNTDNSSSNSILIDNISKINCNFNRLSIYHFLECKYKSNMRYNRYRPVYSFSRIGITCDYVIYHVLQHEEQ